MMRRIINIFRSYSVSIIDKNWAPIINDIRVKHIPRQDEFIWIDEHKSYFKVLNIVYYLTKKQGIFVIVEPHDNIPNKEN